MYYTDHLFLPKAHDSVLVMLSTLCQAVIIIFMCVCVLRGQCGDVGRVSIDGLCRPRAGFRFQPCVSKPLPREPQAHRLKMRLLLSPVRAMTRWQELSDTQDPERASPPGAAGDTYDPAACVVPRRRCSHPQWEYRADTYCAMS